MSSILIISIVLNVILILLYLLQRGLCIIQLSNCLNQNQKLHTLYSTWLESYFDVYRSIIPKEYTKIHDYIDEYQIVIEQLVNETEPTKIDISKHNAKNAKDKLINAITALNTQQDS